MKKFLVNPASWDSQGAQAPGFDLDKDSKVAAGDESDDADEDEKKDGAAPEKKAALQIEVQVAPKKPVEVNPPNQADNEFQKWIKNSDAVVSKQQNREKDWIDEYKGNLNGFTSGTHNKMLSNYRGREGVYQNNWHHTDTWPKLMQVDSYAVPKKPVEVNPPNQADISFQQAIKASAASVAKQQNREQEWEDEYKSNLNRDNSQTHNKRLTNFRAREGVYQNNWHHTDTWPAMN